METPISDFVRQYAAAHPLRLHMPGHKGTGTLGVEPFDITEIDGADVLYRAEGIIRRSEEQAAALFGAAATRYSAEGSSLCIRAMVYLAAQRARERGQRPIIAAGRNAHRVFMTAAALVDAEIAWLYPAAGENHLSCSIDAETLDRALAAMTEKPVAVYITSPDYLGHCADVAALATVCHRHDVLLLVDNAHGAYRRFLPQSVHPMTLGADMCCDSAHKTLPVLTGGAYLHVASGAPETLAVRADEALALFASTSPSYLILQSLDAANRVLETEYPAALAAFLPHMAATRERLTAAGYTLIGEEPLKLTIAAKTRGYPGTALAALLRERGIVCEFADADHLVMMFTPLAGTGALDCVEATLSAIPPRAPLTDAPPAIGRPEVVLSPRAALFAPHETRPTEQCVGRVLGDASVSCPPAVPVLVCGERIDAQAVRAMRYYGMETCCVVAE